VLSVVAPEMIVLFSFERSGVNFKLRESKVFESIIISYFLFCLFSSFPVCFNPRANVIKLFTAVIYCHSLVVVVFNVIKLGI
jgi:hypothetical protein